MKRSLEKLVLVVLCLGLALLLARTFSACYRYGGGSTVGFEHDGTINCEREHPDNPDYIEFYSLTPIK